MTQFESFGLPEQLVKALTRMQFTTPTPIQAQAIPLALQGKDIMGTAQTGTGKTAAFGVPLMAKLINSPRGSALVLLPTRELAMQVLDALQQMGATRPDIKSALLIGGESMPKQLDQLRQRPRIIVGTPGRINDHLERGSLMLHDANFLVLDETDRMLDMGFGIQLEKIFKFLPAQRQTLMFSATLPPNILKISEKYLHSPERISIGSTTTAAPKIQQETLHVREDEKYGTLVDQLNTREGSIIVFVKTKWGAEKMAARLRKEKHHAEAIHGDLQQRRRNRVIEEFRDKKYRILVATDIAARGLDIPHIEHVINYDLPQCPEDYIHRIGRTARNGAEGAAICLITREDGDKWNAIQRLMNPSAAKQNSRREQSHGQPANSNGNNSRKRRRRPQRNRNAQGNGQRQHSARPAA